MARERVERTQGHSTEGTLIGLALLTLTERRPTKMLKNRIIRAIVAVALLAAVAGATPVADALGLAVTAPAHACNAGSGGGGC
jgi:hypothetical protein